MWKTRAILEELINSPTMDVGHFFSKIRHPTTSVLIRGKDGQEMFAGLIYAKFPDDATAWEWKTTDGEVITTPLIRVNGHTAVIVEDTNMFRCLLKFYKGLDAGNL